MSSNAHTETSPSEWQMGKRQLLAMLDEMERDLPNPTATLYTREGGFSAQLKKVDPLEAPQWVTDLSERFDRSPTGVAAFLWEDSASVVLPPFPLREESLFQGREFGPLRELVGQDYVIGAALLRLGKYAAGVYHGDKLVSSKVGSRYVKGRHSAGGTSQLRYSRIRDKQIQEIFGKACEVAKAQLGPYEAALDFLFLGGESHTLDGFLKRCPYLEGLSSRLVGRTLNVREPNKAALDKLAPQIWESRVFRG